MRMYLGMRYVVWALIAWIGLAGTFAVILLYRILISYKDEDELFMGPTEVRHTLEDIHLVDRFAIGFGAASAISLVCILAGWAVGLL